MRIIALLALVAATGASAADTAPPAADAARATPLGEMMRELDAILLAGEALPPDFAPKLAPLPPGERLLAVAYARRAGLLTGPALPLDGLLRARP